MRLKAQRIPALRDDQLNDEQKAVAERVSQPGRPVLNIFRTMANAPKAANAFLDWGSYILSKKNALPPREREIVVLRTGYLCKSGYEWTQHVRIGLGVGLTEAEITDIKAGAGAALWSAADAALIKASDELHADQFITDATWAELTSHFDQKQCMDLVFTAGQYTQVSMILNSFGVQLDEGQVLDPDLKGF